MLSPHWGTLTASKRLGKPKGKERWRGGRAVNGESSYISKFYSGGREVAVWHPPLKDMGSVKREKVTASFCHLGADMLFEGAAAKTKGVGGGVISQTVPTLGKGGEWLLKKAAGESCGGFVGGGRIPGVELKSTLKKG